MASDANTDQTESLGEFLRKERERRGITVEQVASATKISVRLLHLLEEDRFAELPAKPFIRGFVTSYVRFIELEPTEILSRFDRYIEERASERPQRDAGHSGYAFEKREGEQSRTILWIVMGVFIVLGTLAMVILKPKLKSRKHGAVDRLKISASPSPSPTPSVTSTSGSLMVVVTPSGTPTGSVTPTSSPTTVVAIIPTASPTPTPKASPSPKPKPTPKPTPTPTPTPTHTPKPKPTPSPTDAPAPAVSTPAPAAASNGTLSMPAETGKADPLNSGRGLSANDIKHRVVLKTTADVTVRYQVDERPVMQLILRAGRVLVLQAVHGIRFQSSNPKAVSYSWNRNSYKPTEPAGSQLVLPTDFAGKTSDLLGGQPELAAPPPPPSRAESESAPTE